MGIHKGDRVKILGGMRAGLEGEIVHVRFIVVEIRLDVSGTTVLEPADNVHIMEDKGGKHKPQIPHG